MLLPYFFKDLLHDDYTRGQICGCGLIIPCFEHEYTLLGIAIDSSNDVLFDTWSRKKVLCLTFDSTNACYPSFIITAAWSAQVGKNPVVGSRCRVNLTYMESLVVFHGVNMYKLLVAGVVTSKWISIISSNAINLPVSHSTPSCNPSPVNALLALERAESIMSLSKLAEKSWQIMLSQKIVLW